MSGGREAHSVLAQAPWRRCRTPRWLLLLFLILCAVPGIAFEPLPPSPYDILKSRDLATPVLDATPFCIPDGIEPVVDPVLEQARAGEWSEASTMLRDWVEGLDRAGPELVMLDAVLFARGADDRGDRLVAEDRLRSLLALEPMRPHRLCGRLELARLMLLLGRESEAAAQLTLGQRVVDELDDAGPRAEEIAFWRAEILYQRGRRFDAHLAFRKLGRSENPRLALAARLRLTDLSFDAGKAEPVTVEYETLLPRASAFGGSTAGWALRASEAAIDAGDPGRAVRWIEGFLESRPARDARDAAEIRMADLDVAFDDPLRARKRLSTISGRRRGDAIGALAAIRAIDLGVAEGSPDQRVEILLRALRDQRDGVRRYALGVLMRELSHRGDLGGALAVATRLAYDGVDPVITPDYARSLDDLLERVSRRHAGEAGCQELVRALGGRYGILIERASDSEPFARVGGCFERLELPWLAATVYRTIARRFGTPGAQRIALPLARSSLAIGELALARRVAAAALEDPDEQANAWRAILAETDFVEGRYAAAARGLRRVLDAPELARERGKLVRLLALSLGERGDLADARFIAERVPDWLAQDELGPAAHAGMIEAAMLAAHALRRAGEAEAAFALYRVVDREDEAGALRSSARFWLGLAQQPDAAGASAWSDQPEITLGSPWARLALFEEHYEALRTSYAGAIR